MKRARLAAVLFSLAACGSDTTPTGADLCSKAQTVSNNVTQKVSACVPAAGTGIPTGQTCTTALASCNSTIRSS